MLSGSTVGTIGVKELDVLSGAAWYLTAATFFRFSGV